jgi:RHS repeat-associated protein
MTDGAGTVTYSYDGLDRLTGVTRSGHSFAYGYDDNSNRTSETYPDSTVVAYSYTDDEQLHTVASNSQTTSYGYDPAGNLASTAYPSGNGYTETDSYDHAGRLTNVDNHAGATVLSEFDYTLDPVGNPLEVDQTGAISSTTTYGYDSLDRLTLACLQASCPLSTDPKVSWTYDYVGNRLTQTSGGSTVTSTYNSDDRLIARGATSYSYDANGNQTAAGANTFSYDLANRLLTADVSATTTTYSYDGDGNRLQASTGSSPSDKTNFTWDPAADQPQLDAETDGSGNPVRDYLYGNKLISMTTAALATYYYHYDALGSVANLTNSSGATKWTYSYDAWGNPTATPTSGAPDNPVQYTTGYTDPTGLTHLGAREYDPATGRFLQADPANLATGSTYSYTDDRPTTVVDRTGLGASVLGYAVPVAVPFVPDILAQAGAASAGLSYGALFGVGFWVATKVSAGSYSPQHTTELPMATKATPPAPSAFPNFDDPSTPPGDGWEWRGNGAPGSKEGSWYNPGSGESLHPDLDHGEPIGPHYDWKSPSAPNKKGYRVYPDGEVVPK